MCSRSIARPCGLMDKASDFGSEDCRFESCHGRIILYHVLNSLFYFFQVRFLCWGDVCVVWGQYLTYLDVKWEEEATADEYPSLTPSQLPYWISHKLSWKRSRGGGRGGEKSLLQEEGGWLAYIKLIRWRRGREIELSDFLGRCGKKILLCKIFHLI